jgi:hypothetical protein
MTASLKPFAFVMLLAVTASSLPAQNAAQSVAGNAATNTAGNAATNVAINTATAVSSDTPATNQPSIKMDKAADALFPFGLKPRLRLTDAQKADVKTIEADYVQAVLEYKRANQARIDAANEALQKAVAANDAAQIQAARAQQELAWQGLRAARLSAIAKLKLSLTPSQVKLVDDPKLQWRDNPYDQ